MEAGRELDALVAAKIMGWTSVTNRRHADGTWSGIRHDWPAPVIDDVPFFSSDIRAAFLVVEQLRQQWAAGNSTSNFWTFRDCGAQPWQALIELYPDHDANIVEFEADGETLPFAICLCALKAVGAL